MQNNRRRTRGQALVEFALAAILIFFLLSAAIDLGLIFFRHQGLYNASLEGSQYGSHYTKTFTGQQLLQGKHYTDEDLQRIGCYVPNMQPTTNSQYICLDEDAIRDRLVNEAGDNGGINLVNMKDLDSNGVPDDDNLRNDYIEVYAVNTQDVTDPSDPSVACPSIANPPSATCYVYVRVKSDYNMFFALAPAFGNKVDVSAYTIFPVRTGLFQPGMPTGTVVIGTIPPTATSTNTATITPTPSNTFTAVPPTSTNGPSPTKTAIPVGPSATPTAIPPTSTKTATPIPATATKTLTPSATATRTQTFTPSKTPTASQTPTASATRTPSNTRTQTLTPSKTLTPSATETRTQTLTPSKTLTPSLTSTRTNTVPPTTTNTVPPPTTTPTPSNTRTPTTIPSNTPTRSPTVPPSPTKTNTPAPPTRTATSEGT